MPHFGQTFEIPVYMQTRYVTVTLPEDGGNSFQWTVDGIERSFVAPDGKCKGDEHEFTFEVPDTEIRKGCLVRIAAGCPFDGESCNVTSRSKKYVWVNYGGRVYRMKLARVAFHAPPEPQEEVPTEDEEGESLKVREHGDNESLKLRRGCLVRVMGCGGFDDTVCCITGRNKKFAWISQGGRVYKLKIENLLLYMTPEEAAEAAQKREAAQRQQLAGSAAESPITDVS